MYGRCLACWDEFVYHLLKIDSDDDDDVDDDDDDDDEGRIDLSFSGDDLECGRGDRNRVD